MLILLSPPRPFFSRPLASSQTAELEQASSIRSQKTADEKKVQEKIDAAVEAHKVSRSFPFLLSATFFASYCFSAPSDTLVKTIANLTLLRCISLQTSSTSSVPTILSFIHLHSLVFRSQGLIPDTETPEVVKNLSSQEAAAVGKTWHALVVEKQFGVAEKLVDGIDEEVLEGVSCECLTNFFARLCAGFELAGRWRAIKGGMGR